MTKKETKAKAKAVEPKPAEHEEKYPVSDFIMASSKVFKFPMECAAAAFRHKNADDMFTISEAKAIVTKFMTKEVK